MVAEETFDHLGKQSTLEKMLQSPTNFEFTLGRNLGPTLGVGNQPTGTFGNHAFKANLNCQVSARKGDQRSSIEAEKMFFDNSVQENSPYVQEYSQTRAGIYQQSANKIGASRHTPSTG